MVYPIGTGYFLLHGRHQWGPYQEELCRRPILTLSNTSLAHTSPKLAMASVGHSNVWPRRLALLMSMSLAGSAASLVPVPIFVRNFAPFSINPNLNSIWPPHLIPIRYQ